MRAQRGASQALFGLLPRQTVDLSGGIWRVIHWADPVPLPLDQTAVRNAMLEAIAPWAVNGTDDGLAADLHAKVPIKTLAVNKDRGIAVEPFPDQWRCRQCNRLYLRSGRPQKCKCGSMSFAQMQFVAYHSCGAMREPFIRTCRTHNAVAVRLPGTASARELYFFCPECNAPIDQGFPYQRCDCGESMKVNVHRSASAFSPRFVDLVNPTDTAVSVSLREMGGGARALEWVLEGMPSNSPSESGQTYEGFIATMMANGISREFAEMMAKQALAKGEIRAGGGGQSLDIPEETRHRAQEEALSLAAAVQGGSIRISDMIHNTTPPPLGVRS